MMISGCRSVILCAIAILIAACGGGGNSGSKGGAIVVPPDGTFRPAVSSSPYTDVLDRCLTAERTADACRLSRLPYIGQRTNVPSTQDILAHTLVSHPWMATRFQQLLDQMPEDIRLMFRGVTGVVIGADIRPSYYWSVTGAIYLDPADLWLTRPERDTISRAPDYRSEFARELNFVSLWRYVEGNRYAWDYYPLNGGVESRPLSAIVRPMAALLFHELAHANDFIPPARLGLINPNNTPQEQSQSFANFRASVDLDAQAPLNSDLWYGLASVMFDGVTATPTQKQLTADYVGAEFENDGASDDYAYASIYEDTAMLFEEVMMKYHFKVDRELAFTDAPFTGDASCSAYVVRWGQRNRIADPLVESRARLVVQQLLDKDDVSVYFADLPSPRYLTNNLDWCANLTAFGNSSVLQKPSEENIRPTDLKHRHAQ